MSYIGSTPTTQSFIAGTDYFNGDGSTTAFTLSRNVVSVNDIEVVVNNVVQQPNTAYNVSGTTITFTSAPSAGTGNIYARYLSTTTQSITPSQNTVSYSTLNTDLQSGGYSSNFKNRIINGAMMIDQRNAGASVTPAANAYLVDRWRYFATQSSKFTAQQNAGSVTPPTGFTNYLGFTSASAYSPGATDIFYFNQWIEGYNIADLGWGSANAKQVTLSFWVYSSLTGTFGGSLTNATNNRWYVFSYTINAANTWQYVTITIPGDTSGTWVVNNGSGIGVLFSLGTGSTYKGAAGSWGGTLYIGPTGETPVVSTNGATFYITGVQLEKGSTATSFDYRPYGTELSLCERYYQILGIYGAISPTATSTAVYYQIPIRTVMRATPTATFGNSTFDRMTNFGVLDYSGTYTPSINDYQPNAIAYRVNVTSGSSWSANIPMAINPTTKSQAVMLVTAEL